MWVWPISAFLVNTAFLLFLGPPVMSLRNLTCTSFSISTNGKILWFVGSWRQMFAKLGCVHPSFDMSVRSFVVVKFDHFLHCFQRWNNILDVVPDDKITKFSLPPKSLSSRCSYRLQMGELLSVSFFSELLVEIVHCSAIFLKSVNFYSKGLWSFNSPKIHS